MKIGLNLPTENKYFVQKGSKHWLGHLRIDIYDRLSWRNPEVKSDMIKKMNQNAYTI